MSTTVYQYRVYCTTEAAYVTVWSTTEPTTCPNNNTHSINTSLTTIVNEISTSTIRAEENSDGYFETTHVIMNVPSGVPGDISQHDVTWPMDFLLWKTLITPSSDMIGDVITVIAAPETTIGVLTAPVAIGATTFNVNSTVTANIWRGFRVVLFDGVNKDILYRCTGVDKINGTITVDTATTHAFAAGSAVKIGVYVLKDIHVTDTQTIEIGAKGFKGKTLTVGVILRVYYVNNSGTSKVLKWRSEGYNMG